MAPSAAMNPLLETSTSAEANPQVALHPLVILTISDYVTRRTLRQQHGPIVGAIIGAQNGREITMEVAFECKTVVEGEEVRLDLAWFEERLEQYRDVFKAPQLDLVGWFTLGATTGPEPRHIPIHTQIQQKHNLENAILLLFHPDLISQATQNGAKLPLTLFEGIRSNEGSAENNDMEVDNETVAGGSKGLKFRELQYSVETGEAEMISLDFVARGGGNAASVQGTDSSAASGSVIRDRKGKGKNVESMEGDQSTKNYLSAEDDELITSLTAKINAIKMLQSRLDLLTAYLSGLPPSYVTDSSIPIDPSKPQPDHQILRSISALLARLPLLTPSDATSFTKESQQTKSDVELISLLASLTKTVNDAKDLGIKFAAAESGKNDGRRGARQGAMGMGLGGGYGSLGDDFNGAGQWQDGGGGSRTSMLENDSGRGEGLTGFS